MREEKTDHYGEGGVPPAQATQSLGETGDEVTCQGVGVGLRCWERGEMGAHWRVSQRMKNRTRYDMGFREGGRALGHHEGSVERPGCGVHARLQPE